MQTQTPKFHAWLAAEKDAQEAERELHAAMLRFARSASPAPLGEVVLVTQAKRATAHALFTEAMEELKELAESLHHRRILTTGQSLPRAVAMQEQQQPRDERGSPSQAAPRSR